jgi:hypothetical protein
MIRLREVVLGFLEELLGEAQLVLVDLLGSELGEDATQVPLEGVLGDLDDLLPALAEEALEGVVEERLVAGDLEVGDAGLLSAEAGCLARAILAPFPWRIPRPVERRVFRNEAGVVLAYCSERAHVPRYAERENERDDAGAGARRRSSTAASRMGRGRADRCADVRRPDAACPGRAKG